MHPTDVAIQRKFRFVGRNRNLPWYPNKGERTDLVKLFAELGFSSGVEVGTRRGDFAASMCVVNPNLHLTCVDPWAAYNARTQQVMDSFYELAKTNTAGLNITLCRKTSMEAVGGFDDETLDFVYIDGNHKFPHPMLDMIFWTPKVKQGGIVAVHDYDHFSGIDVMESVNLFTRVHHVDPWYITRELNPTAFWVNLNPPEYKRP